MNTVVLKEKEETQGHDPIFRNRDRVPHFPSGVGDLKKQKTLLAFEERPVDALRVLFLGKKDLNFGERFLPDRPENGFRRAPDSP